MTRDIGIAVGVTVGLVTANFIFQQCTSKDWRIAFDRSFFQGVAIATFTLVLSIV